MTAHTYNAVQLKKMEGDILITLNFNLSKVTPLALLKAEERQFSHPKGFNLAKYILELNFLNRRVQNRHQIRLAVAAAVKLVRGIYGFFSVSEEVFMNLTEVEVHGAYK